LKETEAQMIRFSNENRRWRMGATSFRSVFVVGSKSDVEKKRGGFHENSEAVVKLDFLMHPVGGKQERRTETS